MNLGHWIGSAFAALAVIGIAYQLIALAALRRFFAEPAPRGKGQQAVTLLKPLHGAEPRLAANLGTFLNQDYAGPVQFLFGVEAADDQAVATVSTLRQACPQADITLTTGPRQTGANAKIGNITAMLPFAAHDILILSDSDMVVGPDYLATLLPALEQPGVGAVTCLYNGRADVGVWSAISAAAISYTGLPNMVMALSTAIAQPCMGSTIAIRRETLEALGGFERFADVLADDYAIGEAVAKLGLKVAVPPMLLTHACADASFAALWRQHLRWSATIRAVAPKRHAGSGVIHALPFALLAATFLPLLGAVLIALAFTVRLLVAFNVDRIGGVRRRFILLLPLADMLEFAVFIASLVTRKIDWRGSRLRIVGQGRITDRNSSATEQS
jgi:ceramide glucosyltransferase